MKLRTYALVALGGYAFFLVAMAPAWLLSEGMLANSGLRPIAPQGTLWNGSARLHMAPDLNFERLEWHFAPLHLLRGEWAYDVTISDPALKAKAVAARGFAGLRLHDALVDARAGTLSQWIPVLAAFAPAGDVHLEAVRIDFDSQAASGDIHLKWTDAALALSEERPLGSYEAEINLRERRADFRVGTVSGVLRVAGRGTFQPPMQWSFNGQASAEPQALPRLQGILKLLGTPNEKGIVVIQRGEH
jgi:general secretion pathway protein N